MAAVCTRSSPAGRAVSKRSYAAAAVDARGRLSFERPTVRPIGFFVSEKSGFVCLALVACDAVKVLPAA